jgi:hypothetical protein|tara:strand:+ start:192 stop:506 length:315 start_codon:yes stop_codon:yes gene_type:complete
MKVNDKYKKEIQLENRVYRTEEYLSILKDILEDIFLQTHMMSDRDLEYDRHKFMKVVRMTDLASRDKKGFLDYSADIHTLSIMITQLLRYGEILYNEKKEVYER